MKVVLLALVLAFIPLISPAQKIFNTCFSEKHGLNNDIRVLRQDEKGFLWIGTKGGLFKFNGEIIEEIFFGIENSEKWVNDILFDSDNNLWIAGKGGITSYDGNKFEHYKLGDQFPQGDYNHIFELGGGKIGFFLNDQFVFHLENGSMEKREDLLSEKITKIKDIFQSSLDTIWILAEDNKLYGIFNQKFFGGTGIDSSGIESFIFDSSYSDKIVIRAENGLIQIDPDKNIFLNDHVPKADKYPSCWFIDSKGNRWLDKDGEIFLIIGKDTLSTNIAVNQKTSPVFLEDYEGNIWIGVANAGLYRISGYSLCHLDVSGNEEYMPSGFIENDNELWISYFGDGIRIHRDEHTDYITVEDGLVSNYVRKLVKDKNNIWAVTARGLSEISASGIKSYTIEDGLPNNYCYDAIVDQKGRILLGTEGGLAIQRGRLFTSVTKEDGLSSNRIKQILLQSDNSVLLMSDDAIDVYSKGETRVFVREKLKSKEILNSIIKDQFDNYWIGSDMYGLIYLDLENDRVNYLSEKMRLPFSRVRSIITYQENYLCLGTESGIFLCKINSDGEILSLQSIGKQNGYQDFETDINSIYRTDKGILFGTNLGTVIFNPEWLSPSLEKTPNVIITGLDISFKKTEWQESRMRIDPWSNVPIKPVLEHKQNDIKLFYQGISLKSNENLWYKYRLKNVDNEWSAPTRDKNTIYANLMPGRYTFEVKASYDGINWGDKSTTYEMIIAPPFWRTWWFYIAVLSFILVGFILFNNYRIKTKIEQLIAIERVKKEEYDKIQKKVAMDFHDEVGNHLTSISLLVELINNKNWEIPEELKKHLEGIDKESKNLFRGSRDFIWSIDPANDNLKAVFYNLREYGIELFENSRIDFHTRNSINNTGNLKLPPGFTRQIVLIFKEGLNNALKHADCRNVYFSIEVLEKSFKIILQDDGKGFNSDELAYFEGLKKMKFRGAKIKSDLDLISENNSGTKIILSAELYG